MYCGNCGCKVDEDDVFCLNCGSRIETDDCGQDTVNHQIPELQDPAVQAKATRKREPAMFIYPIMGGAIVVLLAIAIWGGLQLNKINKNTKERTESQVDSSSTKASLSSAMEKKESVIQDEADLPAVTVSPTVTPTPAPTQTPVEVSDNSGDYVFSSSSSSFLTRDEIEALSGYDMYLARNEIYARHGRKFVNQDLQQYFGNKSWYTPTYDAQVFDDMQDTVFNDYEKENIKLIKKIEDEYGYHY